MHRKKRILKLLELYVRNKKSKAKPFKKKLFESIILHLLKEQIYAQRNSYPPNQTQNQPPNQIPAQNTNWMTVYKTGIPGTPSYHEIKINPDYYSDPKNVSSLYNQVGKPMLSDLTRQSSELQRTLTTLNNLPQNIASLPDAQQLRKSIMDQIMRTNEEFKNTSEEFTNIRNKPLPKNEMQKSLTTIGDKLSNLRNETSKILKNVDKFKERIPTHSNPHMNKPKTGMSL